jgi:hypothetical protein
MLITGTLVRIKRDSASFAQQLLSPLSQSLEYWSIDRYNSQENFRMSLTLTNALANIPNVAIIMSDIIS